KNFAAIRPEMKTPDLRIEGLRVQDSRVRIILSPDIHQSVMPFRPMGQVPVPDICHALVRPSNYCRGIGPFARLASPDFFPEFELEKDGRVTCQVRQVVVRQKLIEPIRTGKLALTQINYRLS